MGGPKLLGANPGKSFIKVVAIYGAQINRHRPPAKGEEPWRTTLGRLAMSQQWVLTRISLIAEEQHEYNHPAKLPEQKWKGTSTLVGSHAGVEMILLFMHSIE
jgi:hypothetical protein